MSVVSCGLFTSIHETIKPYCCRGRTGNLHTEQQQQQQQQWQQHWLLYSVYLSILSEVLVVKSYKMKTMSISVSFSFRITNKKAHHFIKCNPSPEVQVRQVSVCLAYKINNCYYILAVTELKTKPTQGGTQNESEIWTCLCAVTRKNSRGE